MHLPSDSALPPEYVVLTSAELRTIVLQHESYNARFRQKYGKEYTGKGVVSVKRELIDNKHLGDWEKVARAVGIKRWVA